MHVIDFPISFSFFSAFFRSFRSVKFHSPFHIKRSIIIHLFSCFPLAIHDRVSAHISLYHRTPFNFSHVVCISTFLIYTMDKPRKLLTHYLLAGSKKRAGAGWEVDKASVCTK